MYGLNLKRPFLLKHLDALSKFRYKFGNFGIKNDNMCKFQFLLGHKLGNFDWVSIELNEGFQELINCVNSVIDRYAPLKPMRFKKQTWVDNKIKREITKWEKFIQQ